MDKILVKKNYVIISPHLDDAVISCGDFIYYLRRKRLNVEVTTVFPNVYYGNDLQKSASDFHKISNRGKYLNIFRQKEDRKAMDVLNVSYNHLGFSECLYRKDSNNEFIYNNIYDDINFEKDNKMINEIISFFATFYNIESTVFIFPLGIGNHIDHNLLSFIGNKLEQKFFKVLYYEDLPYKMNLNYEDYKDKVKNKNGIIIPLDKSDFYNKLEAYVCYSSQINVVWNSLDDAIEDFKKIYLMISNQHEFSFKLFRYIKE